MLKNIKLGLFLRNIIKTIIIKIILFIFIFCGIYYFGSKYFLISQNSEIVQMIYENIQDNTFLEKKYSCYTDSNIEVKFQGNLYSLVDQNFIPIQRTNFKEPFFLFTISNDIIIHFPYYIEYKQNNNIIIKVGLNRSNEILLFFIFVFSFIIFIYTILYYTMIYKKMKSIHDFKLSAQEYALSEKTASFLISIIHHKLNTPLKIIVTKSRVLAQTIFDHGSDKMILKAQEDLSNINNALKTIFEITDKLKLYQSRSVQSETNIYTILNFATETIKILSNDEITIDIDDKIKLFKLDKNKLTSYEMIQIFINQIKFSIENMSTEINIKLTYTDSTKIKILFSDNGNSLDKRIINLFKNKKIFDLDFKNENKNYLDLILNLNILMEADGNLQLLNSTDGGTSYEFTIPAIKINLKNQKKSTK